MFPATNNEAEYEEILIGLRVGKALGAKNLLFQSDLRLFWANKGGIWGKGGKNAEVPEADKAFGLRIWSGQVYIGPPKLEYGGRRDSEARVVKCRTNEHRFKDESLETSKH